jgi:hypothetical protein
MRDAHVRVHRSIAGAIVLALAISVAPAGAQSDSTPRAAG